MRQGVHLPQRQGRHGRGRLVQHPARRRPEGAALRRAVSSPRSSTSSRRKVVDATTLELVAEGALRDPRHAAGGVHASASSRRTSTSRTPSAPARSPTSPSTPARPAPSPSTPTTGATRRSSTSCRSRTSPTTAPRSTRCRPGQIQTVDNLPYNLIDTIKGAGGGVAGLRDRRLGAVHHARRRRAVLRRPGAPGDAPDRRPPADDRPDAERLRLARQRHVRPVRRGLRQRPAPARAGHRPGQVAAQPRRARRVCRSSCSPATTSARSRRPRPTCSSSRPRRPASTSRSPRRRRSTTTSTCPTRSPRTSGTPATTSRRPWSARSRRSRAAPTTRPTGTTRSTATSSTPRPRSSTRPSATELLHDAQEIEYNEGGLIIWGFRQQVDGYGANVQGLEPSKYLPLGSYKFNKRLGPVGPD